MIKRDNLEENRDYVDYGPSHSGPFSSDFHKSGMDRYLKHRKKRKIKNGILAFYERRVEISTVFNRGKKIETPKINLDPEKFKILSKFFDSDENL